MLVAVVWIVRVAVCVRVRARPRTREHARRVRCRGVSTSIVSAKKRTGHAHVALDVLVSFAQGRLAHGVLGGDFATVAGRPRLARHTCVTVYARVHWAARNVALRSSYLA